MKVISCGVIIIDKETRKILACHPSCHSYKPGNWDIPKGHVEKGETAEHAAIRETCEELLVTEDQVEILHPQEKKKII